MRLVYVMDPVEGLLPDKDTTFAFQRAAAARGHENLHVAAERHPCRPHGGSVA